MKYLILIFCVGLSTTWFSCSSSKAKQGEKLLEEAAALHLSALQLEKEFKPILENLMNRSNQIQVQGRALTEDEMTFTDAVMGLQQRYAYWEENHIEVPGFEDAHGHEGHDHHHHGHGSKIDVTPEEMLILQTEFKKSMEGLLQQAKQL